MLEHRNPRELHCSPRKFNEGRGCNAVRKFQRRDCHATDVILRPFMPLRAEDGNPTSVKLFQPGSPFTRQLTLTICRRRCPVSAAFPGQFLGRIAIDCDVC
jgi:hypothetical protein